LGNDIVTYREFPDFTVIEFDSIGFLSHSCSEVLRFEALLYTDGRVKLQYHTFEPAGCENYSATIGIQSGAWPDGIGLGYLCGSDGIDPVSGLAIWFYVPTTGSADNMGLTPDAFMLCNYPNPFNAVTEIRYDLPQNAHVSLVLYNTLGQEVRTLVNTAMPAGRQTAVWDGRDNLGCHLSSGLYILRLDAANATKVVKLVLIR
jgi:hypothetical protein